MCDKAAKKLIRYKKLKNDKKFNYKYFIKSIKKKQLI